MHYCPADIFEKLTNEEWVDIYFVYGFCDGTVAAAVQEHEIDEHLTSKHFHTFTGQTFMRKQWTSKSSAWVFDTANSLQGLISHTQDDEQ